MSYSWASSDMVSLVQTHANSSAMYKWNNAVLVSTYAGDILDDSFWSDFKSGLASDGITISLAPAFTSYRDPSEAGSLMSTYPSIDGFFNWWSWYVHRLSCLFVLTSWQGLMTLTPTSPPPPILRIKQWSSLTVLGPILCVSSSTLTNCCAPLILSM